MNRLPLGFSVHGTVNVVERTRLGGKCAVHRECSVTRHSCSSRTARLKDADTKLDTIAFSDIEYG